MKRWLHFDTYDPIIFFLFALFNTRNQLIALFCLEKITAAPFLLSIMN